MSAAAPAASRQHERALLWTLAIALMLVPLNSTMIAVALPTLIDDLHSSVGAVSWLVTAYLIAMGGLQPIGGTLGDRVGRRPLVLGGLAVFALGSAGAAAVSSLDALIAFRLVQAVSGAIVFPNAIALLREAAGPGELGSRVGTVTSVLPLSAAAGPPLGGLLLAVSGWQALFLVNLPLLAIALTLGWRSVPRPEPRPAGHEHVGLRQLPGLFRRPAFAGATGGIALSNMAMYVIVLAVPLLLSRRGGWGHEGVGAALGAMFVAAFAVSPTGGRLVDRLGCRLPTTAGLALQAAAVALLAVAPGSIGAAPLVALLIMSGVGIGISGPGLQVAALQAVPTAASGIASGAYSTSRYVGSIIGTLLLAGPLAPDGLAGFGLLFAVFAGAAGGGVVLAALLLPGRPGTAPDRGRSPAPTVPDSPAPR